MVAVQHQPQPDAASPVVLVDPATSFDGGFFLTIDELVVDRSIQTRHDRDPDVVAGIFASMKARLERGHHPQEMPAWVTRHGNRWLLLAGFTRDELLRRLSAEMQNAPGLPEEARRWLARPTIWVVHKHAPTPYRAIVENLRENLGRQNLSIADETEAMARLQDLDPTRPLADIAADLDRSTRGTANLLRAYRELSPEMWGAFRRGTLPQRGAIKLAGIKDANARREAFELLTDPEARKKAREAKAAAKAARAPKPLAAGEGVAADDAAADDGTVDELYTLGVRARHAMRALAEETTGVHLDSPYLDGIHAVLTYIETADLGVLGSIRIYVRRLRSPASTSEPLVHFRRAPHCAGSLALNVHRSDDRAEVNCHGCLAVRDEQASVKPSASEAASVGASVEKVTPVPDLQPAASAAASRQAKSGKLHRRDPSGRGARCNYRITDPARLTDDPDLVGCDTCAGRVGYGGGEKPNTLALDGASPVTTWTAKATTAALLERAKQTGRYTREELEATGNELGRRLTGLSTPVDIRISAAIDNLRAQASARASSGALLPAKATKAAKGVKAKPKAAKKSRATKGRR